MSMNDLKTGLLKNYLDEKNCLFGLVNLVLSGGGKRRGSHMERDSRT